MAKFTIESDGTSVGTKVTLNDEVITDTKNITNIRFYANSASIYPLNANETPKRYPEWIAFEYTAIDENDEGEKVYTNYKYDLSEKTWVSKALPLGKVESTEVKDNFIGSDSTLIKDILSYKDKVTCYIPTRDELINRTPESLTDLLEDLKKEG